MYYVTERVRSEPSVELHYLHDEVEVLWNRIQSRGSESPPIQREDLGTLDGGIRSSG